MESRIDIPDDFKKIPEIIITFATAAALVIAQIDESRPYPNKPNRDVVVGMMVRAFKEPEVQDIILAVFGQPHPATESIIAQVLTKLEESHAKKC